MAAADALVVEDLHKRFGELEVLKGISMNAREGDVIAIIGSSGSGKSTFLRCINLLETPDAGKVLDQRRAHQDEAHTLGNGNTRRPETGRAPARSPGHGVPRLQPLVPHDRAGEHHRSAGARPQEAQGRGGRAGQSAPRQGRDRRPARLLSQPSLGRPATARRHRPGAGDGAGRHAVRRTHFGARSRTGGRGPQGGCAPWPKKAAPWWSSPTRWGLPARRPRK